MWNLDTRGGEGQRARGGRSSAWGSGEQTICGEACAGRAFRAWAQEVGLFLDK